MMGESKNWRQANAELLARPSGKKEMIINDQCIREDDHNAEEMFALAMALRSGLWRGPRNGARARLNRLVAKTERDRARRAYHEAERKVQTIEDDEPLYSVFMDALNLGNRDLWNKEFVRLRARMIMLVQLDIARLESDYGSHVVERDSRLDRAREILKTLLLPSEDAMIDAPLYNRERIPT